MTQKFRELATKWRQRMDPMASCDSECQQLLQCILELEDACDETEELTEDEPTIPGRAE